MFIPTGLWYYSILALGSVDLYDRLPLSTGSEGRDGRVLLYCWCYLSTASEKPTTQVVVVLLMRLCYLSTASESKVTSRGGRVLLWSWWMLSLVVMSAYSGTLTSFLSVSQQPKLFSTPEDLLSGSHGYTWGAVKANAMNQIMKVF